MSIGIIYDNTIRNNGTAIYCYRSLELLGVDVWHYLPSGQPIRKTAPPYESHDYYIYIDDGRDDLGVPDLPQPCAYWAIDTHLGFDHRFAMAQQMEHVFTAQQGGAAKMKELGHPNAHWLPLGCHPEAHVQIPSEKIYDIAFVGFLNSDWKDCPKDHYNRVEWLDNLFRAFPNSWLATNVFFEEMSLQFCRAKLGFNISIKQDLNMRFFEVLSTGTALLSNMDQVGWRDLGFLDGVDFIGYDSWEECLEKAKYYLEHDEDRELIAYQGLKRVRDHHTYCHRMRDMLETIGIPCPLDPDIIMQRYGAQVA